jgi:response regulator RpfG family c-di-GMP phosphodiesterase
MASAGAELVRSEVEARILIVDDEPEIAAMVAEACQDANASWHVETVTDPKQAMDRLGEESFDCLITDLVMPTLGGLDLAGEARRLHENLALIAISGHATVEAGIQALRLGFSDFIQKPFDLATMSQAVARAVRRTRHQERLETRFAELAESNTRLEAAESQLFEKLQIASHDLVLSNRRMARQIDEVATTATVARSLMGVLELEDLLGLCAELIGDRVECRSSIVALYEIQEAAVGLMVRAHPDSDVPPSLCWLRTPLTSGVLCRAAQAQKTVHVEDISDSVLMDPLEKDLWCEGRILAVPIPFQGASVGIAVLHRTPDAADFSAHDVKLVAELAKTIGSAILTAKVHHQQRCQIYAALESIAEAVETRDPYMKGHSVRVLAYAEQLSPSLELTQAQIGALQISARLHDLGRLVIPDVATQHAGPLSDEQWDVVRKHPEATAGFLRNLDFLTEIADIVRSHHESYDGTGYPDMKAGDEIPIVSRLLAIADAFDAMTSRKPYREAMSIEEACNQLRQMAGQQFDPQMVEAFLAIPVEILEGIQHRGR